MNNVPIVNPGGGFQGFNIPERGGGLGGGSVVDPTIAKRAEEERKRQVRIERALTQRIQRHEEEIRKVNAAAHQALMEGNAEVHQQFTMKAADLKRQKAQAMGDMTKAGLLFEIKSKFFNGEGVNAEGKPMDGYFMSRMNSMISNEAEKTKAVFEMIGGAIARGYEIASNDPERPKDVPEHLWHGKILSREVGQALVDSHGSADSEAIRAMTTQLFVSLQNATTMKNEEDAMQHVRAAGAAVKGLQELGVGGTELSAIMKGMQELSSKITVARSATVLNEGANAETLNAKQIKSVAADPMAITLAKMGSWMGRLSDVDPRFRFDYVDEQERLDATNIIPEFLAEIQATGFNQDMVPALLEGLDPELAKKVEQVFVNTVRQIEATAQTALGRPLTEDEITRPLYEDMNLKNTFGGRMAGIDEDYTELTTNAQNALSEYAFDLQDRAATDAAELQQSFEEGTDDMLYEEGMM